jgi:hypothetical protein
MEENLIEDKDEVKAYEPKPGCIIDETGCHRDSYYKDKYIMNEKFNTFFNQSMNTLLTFNNVDNIVIDYAKNHNGIVGTTINYDELLWNLFEIDKDKTFKLYEIEKYALSMLPKVSPCFIINRA